MGWVGYPMGCVGYHMGWVGYIMEPGVYLMVYVGYLLGCISISRASWARCWGEVFQELGRASHGLAQGSHGFGSMYQWLT